MPLAEGGSTRAVPRALVGVLALSLAAWAATAAFERASPPALISRVKWVPLAELNAPERAVFYEFSAAWCEPCIAQDEAFQDEALVELLHRRAVPVRVVDRMHEDGVNAPSVEALLKRYEVTSFPTLVLQPPHEGKPLVLRGYQRADVLMGVLEH